MVQCSREQASRNQTEEIFGVEEQQRRGRGGWIMLTATLSASLALVLLSVIVLARHLGDRAPRPHRPDLDDPLRIVDEMFASGEIDLKDYQDRRARLRKLERGR